LPPHDRVEVGFGLHLEGIRRRAVKDELHLLARRAIEIHAGGIDDEFSHAVVGVGARRAGDLLEGVGQRHALEELPVVGGVQGAALLDEIAAPRAAMERQVGIGDERGRQHRVAGRDVHGDIRQ